MKKIPVHVYSTYLTIRANQSGYIGYKNGHIRYVISAYSIPHFNAQGKYVNSDRYYIYEEDTQTYRFPRNALNQLEKCFTKMREAGIDVELDIIKEDPISPRIISGSMQSGWEDRPEHIPVLEHFAQDAPMLATELQTGKGKTYIGIKAGILRSTPIFVLCNGLMEQWVDNFLEKTTIPKDKICILQGGSSIVDCIDKLREDPDAYSVIVASIQTIRNWIVRDSIPYTEILTFEDFLIDLYKPGVFIHDEFHLDFNAFVTIDLYSNVKTNYYLSATARRNEAQEKMLYYRVYPSYIFGNKNQYDKYVDIQLINYRLDLRKDDKRFTTFYGYSHNKYETIILREEGLLSAYLSLIEKVIGPAYFYKYESGTARCIVYAATQQMCMAFRDFFRLKFPLYDTRTYLSSDPLSNLEADVIIGTPKGLGVGRDIAKLGTVLNTVSLAADARMEQMVGRLRKIEGINCVYVDMYNSLISHQARHAYTKRKLYSKLGRTFEMIDL